MTCKTQSFFNYFLSKDVLIGKNQIFFDYFLSEDNLTDKNQSFFDNFFSKDAMTGKNQIFFDYILSKDDLTGKNQSFFDNFIWNLRKKNIVWCIKNQTKVYSNFLFIKSWRNNFIFLPVLYLVMSLMKAQKNFGKIATLKKWELVSLVGAKTHFGKIDLK